MSDFHQSHSKRTACHNTARRFKRLCATQDQAEWWGDMERVDPQAAHAVLRKFAKHVEQLDRKDKFNVLEYKRRLVKRRGARASHKKKWMWKEEFVEEMQTTKHGSYTSDEAMRMWKAIIGDDKVR